MKHRITAAIAAATIALTSAAPVRADNNDLFKLAIGAVGVGILVHELDKKNREEIANANQNAWNDWNDDWKRDGKRYGNKRDGRMIPAQCVFDGKIRGRWREVVSQNCMRDFGMSRRLPGDCRVIVKNRGDRETAYGLNCLEHAGYRVGRARR